MKEVLTMRGAALTLAMLVCSGICVGCASKAPEAARTTTQAATTVLGGVIDISAGADDACALMADHTVQCWGGNWTGQIGDGTSQQRLTATPVPGLANVVQVSVGGDFTCAVESDGSVWCWGLDNLGQLGDGMPQTWQGRPVRIAIGGAVRVGAGGDHACALINNGTVECWGYNHWGAVGYGGHGETWTAPIVVGHDTGILTNAIEIAVGGLQSCAVLSDQTMRCWGNNYYGSACIAGFDYALSPQTTELGPVSEVALGTYFGCAKQLSDGSVQCWGSNYSGQLGSGSTDYRPYDQTTPPQRMTSDADQGMNLSGLSLGANFGTAVRNDGALVTWGLEEYGELADGNNAPVDTAACLDHPNNCRAHPIAPYWGITKVAAGGYFACALRTDATVLCWGHNASGQLGDGTTNDHPTPMPVVGSTAGIPPSYQGWLDGANCSSIGGWAWDANQPNVPISVSVWDNGALLATIPANQYRQDLANAGIGNGYHGFNYSLPALQGTHSIGVFAGGTTTELSGSPQSVTCGTVTPTYVGCFADWSPAPPWTSNRDLPYYAINNGAVSTEICASTCRNAGYLYAGTQYSAHCFCGNSYGSYGASGNCNMPCSANGGEICGGAWANSVYRTQ